MAQPLPDLQGLTDGQAARLFAEHGPNLLPGAGPEPMARIVLRVLLEPMFMMLLAAGAVYLAIGDMAEALFLLGSVFAVIGLDLAQERKTQRALEALRDLSAPRALVIRQGQERRIASRDVVPGDLLSLHEGDRIAADAVLIEGQLGVDESLLTGEAVPQQKLPGPQPASALSASTVVTSGAAVARVHATGARTAVGRIGAALTSLKPEPSRLQRESRRVVRITASAGMALAAGLVLLSWLWDGRSLLDSLLPGIALAMAALPEEIPVVFTVFLALGAWRLSHHKVLTRRMQAVEILGAITVLAVDKTGTLTLNRMQVAQMWREGASFADAPQAQLPQAFEEAVRFMLLATPASPFDPMEKAILSFGRRHAGRAAHPPSTVAPVREYALTRETLAVTHAFANAGGGTYVLAAKGAPEAIADLCRLEPRERDELMAQVRRMAESGMRVLGIARGDWTSGPLPDSQRDLKLRLLGLVGLVDPPRPEAPAAMATCARAGIRVIMMTGDHPTTACAIAGQVGLGSVGAVLTGADIDAMDDAALRPRLARNCICARLSPEHKLRLVRVLQGAGETVGMTGDGVNDAPALKAADVGIAMGERGTDVAREAAALVLLDDSFASIIAAIRQGRRIDDNLRTAVRFIFAVHVPIIALALGPVLMHWPVLLLPAQIVLLELIIDPTCSILFEADPPAPDLMERAPRQTADSPFTPANMAYGVFQGLGLAAILLAQCWLLTSQGWTDAAVRTTAFLSLVPCLFLLVTASRDRQALRARLHNRWLPRIALAVLAVLALLLAQPWLRQVMGFTLPPAGAALAVAAAVAATACWLVVLGLLAVDTARPHAA